MSESSPVDGVDGIDDARVVIIGCGAAGLSAAVAAAETVLAGEAVVDVTVLERTGVDERGGGTRHTGAFLRVEEDFSPASSFEEDVVAFSDGRSDRSVVRRLAAEAKETLSWVEDLGVKFDAIETHFLTSNRPRLLPVGGGQSIVDVLADRAQRMGVEIAYRRTATSLVLGDAGEVVGLVVRDNDSGALETLRCRAVIIASGGFEGDQRLLTQYLGRDADHVRNISPGGENNRGEGITMAIAAGAGTSGQWDKFHAEPIDPRSSSVEAAVMIFPYGVIVGRDGHRFLDEGRATVDETYEDVARQILARPDGTAFCITDQQTLSIQGYQRAVAAAEPPVQAETLTELAAALGIDDVDAFVDTIDAYNDAVTPGSFDAFALDGLSTVGLTPPKSNWARRIDQPPFVAWPMSCAIVFTFGGLAADAEARVTSADGVVLPGLYAAGEVTGLYYGKYPGATSVLRSLVFGRIAGRNAVSQVVADLGSDLEVDA